VLYLAWATINVSVDHKQHVGCTYTANLYSNAMKTVKLLKKKTSASEKKNHEFALVLDL
jgi:hypothetical protein